MLTMLAAVVENVNTGLLGPETLPLIIAGCVLVAAAIFGVVMSQMSKKNKKKNKAQKKNNGDE